MRWRIGISLVAIVLGIAGFYSDPYYLGYGVGVFTGILAAHADAFGEQEDSS